MKSEEKTPAGLIYEQAWEDVKYLLMIITIIFVILFFTSEDPEGKYAFIFVYLYFVTLIIVIYNFFAVRKFEVYPDRIIITFPRNEKRVITKDEIEKIEIERIPGFLLLNRAKWPKIVFRFYFKNELNVLFYKKKFSINNYLLGDTTTGERTVELVNYLRRYYKSVLNDLSGL